MTSPFTSTSKAETTVLLGSITNNATSLTTSFNYDPAGSGELVTVNFPYGGHFRWAYGNESYASQRTTREITAGYLLWDPNIGERTFAFARDNGDSSRNLPLYRQMSDLQANATKAWYVNQSGTAQGLISTYNESSTSPQTLYRLTQYTWAQDASGNNYIGRTQETTDPASNTPVTKQIDQTLDIFGNVVQTKLYGYSDLSNPAKTYNNTFLAGANYTSQYIYNRLLTSTLTAGSSTLTLATNNYDGSAPTDAPGITQHDLNYSTSLLYRGNVTSSMSFGHTQQFAFDITGTAITASDGNPNHSISISTGVNTNYAAPTAITTANALTTLNGWDSLLNPTSATGPNGDVNSSAYDSASRPSSTTSAYGAVTTYSYSTAAPQITAKVNSQWTQTYLDGLGRTIRVARGNGTTTVSYTDTVYDTCGCTPTGKPYKTSLPYSPGSTPAWKVNTYDAIGRTLTSVAPDGASTTSYSYAGNTITITDATGKWKQYVSDAFGQLIQVVEQSPNTASEPNHVTTYAYDILGHLIQVQMPRTINGGVVTQMRSWVYDPATQLLTSQTAPENGTTSYSYNADSTLATTIDAKGQQKQFTYDVYARLIQVARGQIINGQFAEDATQRTSFMYDGTNGGFSSNTAGRVSQISYTGPHGLQFSELYGYHAAGAVTVKRVAVSGAAVGSSTVDLDASYAYDAMGNVSTVQYPLTGWNGQTNTSTAGPQYGYTYDAMNRIGGMTGPNSQNLVSSVLYGPADQILQLNAAAFSETRTYNMNLQLAEVVSGTNVHIKYNYAATQNNGRILSQTDVVSGETIAYTYDSLNRLINASATGDLSGAWSQSFSYDGFGNLTQKNGFNAPTNTSLATDPLTNRLTTNGAGYDANGNMTASGTGSFAVAYAFDIENRLTVSNPNGGNQTIFGYDASNQRVYQGTFNPNTSTYSNELLYFYGVDGKKLVVYSLQSSGSAGVLNATQTNIWFAGRILAPQDRLQSQGKYFPYGEDRYSPVPANPDNDREKFATYTRDSATWLDYAYQRYYSNQSGRFISSDPSSISNALVLPENWNRYAYVGGDPTGKNDPLGLCSPSDNPPCYSSESFAGPDPDGVPLIVIYTNNYSDGLGNLSSQNSRPTGAYHKVSDGGNGAMGAIRSAVMTAQKALRNSSASSQCAKDLAKLGLTPDSLASAINVEDFNNGLNNSTMLYTLFSPGSASYIAARSRNLTVGQALTPSPQNGTVAMASVVARVAFINPAWIGVNDAQDNSALVAHETLHSLTGLDDSQLQSRLGLPAHVASQNISNLLSTDCFYALGR